MTSSPCHIITRGFGKIMSAATFILAAGDERIMGAHSWFMMHELSDWMGREKLADLKHNVKHSDEVQKQMYKMYEELAKGKTKSKTFERLCQKDHYISAEKVLKLGLIDKILEKR